MGRRVEVTRQIVHKARLPRRLHFVVPCQVSDLAASDWPTDTDWGYLDLFMLSFANRQRRRAIQQVGAASVLADP